MGILKRGGYLFVSWIGDHSPRHVHIFKDQKCIAKYDLEKMKLISGTINSRVLNFIKELISQGKL
jgi:hypothetical protein